MAEAEETVAEEEPMFAVDGPCSTRGGSCVRSPNYPASYGNEEACTITPLVPMAVTATAFSTYYSYLTVNGVRYSGSAGPGCARRGRSIALDV